MFSIKGKQVLHYRNQLLYYRRLKSLLKLNQEDLERKLYLQIILVST